MSLDPRHFALIVSIEECSADTIYYTERSVIHLNIYVCIYIYVCVCHYTGPGFVNRDLMVDWTLRLQISKEILQ